MKNNLKNTLLITVLGLMACHGKPALGQHIINMVEYEIPVNFDLVPEDHVLESIEDEALFFLGMEPAKLIEAAKSSGDEIQMMESVIYLKGSDFAFESNSEAGKITLISVESSNKLYMVMWDMKQVLVITPEEVGAMKEQADNYAEEMIKNLPPEMQEQVREQMATDHGSEASPDYEVQETGRTKIVHGFDCAEYLLESDGHMMMIWAAEDQTGLADQVAAITDKFKQMFPDEGDEMDEWDLMAGKIPVEVLDYYESLTAMGEPGIVLSMIEGIKNTNPPNSAFIPPGTEQGFTYTSFSEFMKQMMQGVRPD
jgi:hypothetical protein